MTGMNQEDLRQLDTVLQAHLKNAIPELRGLLSNLREGEHLKEPMDEADLASVRYDRDLMVQIQYRNYHLIEEIHGALRRIEKGIYGICLECGQEIDLKRLKVQPTAAVCIDCKKELERI